MACWLQMYADVATLMRRALPALAPAALTLRVATTNIRYDNSNDKFGTVPARCGDTII